jgi:multidrug resistance efflux pump
VTAFRLSGSRVLACAALLALPLSAFAGKNEAQLELTSARANVASAERAGAARHATNELSSARELLARAEGSFDDRDWTDAEREAERAKAEARVAETRARQRSNEALLAELEATIRTLRNEIAREGAPR